MPHRIIGTEKCSHINKKTGLQDCNKLGRFNPKPRVSWNNQRKFDRIKKRQYVEFIHNDGTSHILGRFKDYQLSQMKGEPSEDLFKGLVTLASLFHYTSNFFYRVAEASLKWNLREGEEQLLVNALKVGNFEPIITKYNQSEHERRRQIYEKSQKVNEEKYRNYGTLQFQVDDVDRIARKSLGLSSEDLKLELYELTEEQFIKVYERFNELVNAYEKWLYDRRKLFEQVAREKFNGKIPPELERKMSARY